MKTIKGLANWIRRHKIISVIAIAAVVALIFVFSPKKKLPIETVTLKRSNLVQSLSVSGTIGAKNTASLFSPSTTTVVYLGANLGDSVARGQTIAILDQRAIEKNIENAVKAYNKQKISFDIVNDFNGNRSLADTGLSIDARRQLETALAALDQAQIALDIQRIAKEQSVLFSPINGILTRSGATAVGVTVSPTTTFTITDPESLVFNIDVDEADVGKVKPGQAVSINLDAYPDQNLHFAVSRIDFVSHATLNGGNAFTAEVKLTDSAQNSYRVGMSGNAEIILAEKNNVITVPSSSIFDTDKVYLKTKKGYEKKTVVLGLQNDTDAEIVSGLSEGNEVVLIPSNIKTKH